MEKRGLALLVLAGGGAAAWWISRQGGAGIYAPVDLGQLGVFDWPDWTAWTGGDAAGDAGGGGDGDVAPLPITSTGSSSNYLAQLQRAEDPGGGLYVKNPMPGQTASGKYQFTKATWTTLGGDWGSDPTKAFGGLFPSEAEQDAMAAKLTASNASVLTRIGVGVSNAMLYAAHFLGPGRTASALPQILNADRSASLTNFLPANVVKLNPAIGKTVGSFLDYFTAKMGGG